MLEKRKKGQRIGKRKDGTLLDTIEIADINFAYNNTAIIN